MTEKTHATRQSQGSFAPVGSHIYPVLFAIMAVVFILSNIGAAKGVQFGPILTDGGFFLFPVAYIVGDIISEVYGFKASRRVIFTTFLISAFASLTYWIIIILPPADFYDGQDALTRTLGPVPLIVLASLAGFAVGQLSNAKIMVAMKQRSGERYLFGRIAVSTLVGELLDTIAFAAIAATVIGIETFGQYVVFVLVGWVWKTAVELILAPATIWVIGKVKTAEPHYGTTA
ncbi:MAG TPA: queuosine precursor transporter [Enteractinococcus sp.]